MSAPRHPFNTASALHRIFISPLIHAHTRAPSRPLLSLPPAPPAHLSRAYHPSPLLSAASSVRISSATKIPPQRFPRDNAIPNTHISLVNAEGKLDAPVPKAFILANLDRTKETLLCVTAPPSDTSQPAIARVVTIASLLPASSPALSKAERLAAKQKESKKGGAKEKIIELNWAIDANDLEHRLGRLKGFLEKGYRVEVSCAGKKKGRTATKEEAEGVVGRIREAVGSVKGAQEVKKEGAVGGTWMAVFEGPRE